MKPQPLFQVGKSHRDAMTNPYRAHSQLNELTRDFFSTGQRRLIDSLDIRPGERIVEVGCGTGTNFAAFQERLQGAGEVIGVDSSQPMLRKAADRVLRQGWKNVRLVDMKYGRDTVTRGRADVVVFSYSLSMIPDWRLALACAQSELWPGGRVGVVDFYRASNSSRWFTDWLSKNHVNVGQPYEQELRRLFHAHTYMRCDAWAGLWSFYLFVGARTVFLRLKAG
jgi:S-adenosylmethionine-diacylgycerolhomoserine-N-methlytransferase